jgi:hypothetical protein
MANIILHDVGLRDGLQVEQAVVPTADLRGAVWTRSGGLCFEALSAAGMLFSLNALTGLVLVNGWPLCSLPNEIRQHALYVRCFGDRDFEVTRLAGRVLATARPISGRAYTFEMRGAALLVTEKEESTGLVLEFRVVQALFEGVHALLRIIGRLEFKKNLPDQAQSFRDLLLVQPSHRSQPFLETDGLRSVLICPVIRYHGITVTLIEGDGVLVDASCLQPEDLVTHPGRRSLQKNQDF